MPAGDSDAGSEAEAEAVAEVVADGSGELLALFLLLLLLQADINDAVIANVSISPVSFFLVPNI